MEKKDAIVILWQNGDEKIADIYDDNADVRSALNALVDGFEYPDFSHKQVKAVLLAYFLKNKKEFELGRTLAHHAVVNYAQENNIDLMPYFYNHSQCNWGMLNDNDQLANYIAVELKENRLISKYRLDNNESIWIITDWESDEQPRLTTAIFPRDY